jgi:FtsH-binding integral membrane protein
MNLLSVYLTLIVQLVITFLIVYYMPDETHSIWTSLLYVVLIVVVVVLILISKKTSIKLMLFILFSVVSGLFMSGYISSKKNRSTVKRILVGAISIFVCFSTLGFLVTYMGINLSWMGYILFSVLMSSLVWLLVMFIFFEPRDTSKIHKVWMWLVMVLFSLYIVYDTNMMLDKTKNGDNFVDVSLGFYLDFMNIFSIMMRRIK